MKALGMQSTRNFATRFAELGGKVVFVGLYEPDSNILGNLVIRNEINVYGPFVYTDDDFRSSADFINTGLSEIKIGMTLENWRKEINNSRNCLNDDLLFSNSIIRGLIS